MTTTTELHPVAEDVAAAAFLIARERERAGHTRWDRAGIEPVIWRLHQRGHQLPRILAAGWNAAHDPDARTPLAIGWPKHRGPDPAPDDPQPTGPRCDVCSQPEPRCRNREARLPVELRHDFTPRRPSRRADR